MTVCSLLLLAALFLPSAVWGRIFTVEDSSDLSCIVDGNDKEAVTWEFLEFTTIDKMAKLQSEISAFRIWPGNQIYSASKNLEFLIGWPTVSNLDALYEHANFEPVTDSRWHDFEILKIGEGKNIDIDIIKDNDWVFHFSLLSKHPVIIDLYLRIVPYDFRIKIDDTFVSANGTVLYKTSLGNISYPKQEPYNFLVAIFTDKPLLNGGMRWRTFSLVIKQWPATVVDLSSEGTNLFHWEYERINIIEKIIIRSGTTKSQYLMKINKYNMKVAPSTGVPLIGDFTLDKNGPACLAVKYFSAGKEMILTIKNLQGSPVETFSLNATESWKSEKLITTDLGKGSYRFEIRGGLGGNGIQAIGGFRVCNENDFYVYKRKQGSSVGSKCYSLATGTSSTLQSPDLSLNATAISKSPIFTHENNPTNCPGKNDCKKTIICDSKIGGCFCWKGWTGTKCDEACRTNEYGYNCKNPCGVCKTRNCDRFTGHCSSAGCDENFIPPLCVKQYQKLIVEEAKKEEKFPVIYIIVGVGLLVLILAITLSLIIWRKRRNNISTTTPSEFPALENRQPQRRNIQMRYSELMAPALGRQQITKEKFADYFQSALNSGQLEKDFESLPRGQQNQWNVGTNSENIGKNRYNEMAAYDFNRVVLSAPDDYINASFIRGYKKSNTYIAAQGPKSGTITDFWRMIVQEEVSTIVMLCQVNDGQKVRCQKYWPDLNCKEIYGEIKVLNFEEKRYDDFFERKLKVTDTKGTKEVVQLHYIAWPQQGVPLELGSLTQLMQIVQANKQIPILVHCSGGTGRTGTIILVDQCLRKLTRTGAVNVLETLKKMRLERVNLVETLDQYKLAHFLIIQLLKTKKF